MTDDNGDGDGRVRRGKEEAVGEVQVVYYADSFKRWDSRLCLAAIKYELAHNTSTEGPLSMLVIRAGKGDSGKGSAEAAGGSNEGDAGPGSPGRNRKDACGGIREGKQVDSHLQIMV